MLFFVGPTGVGKTELAKTLAEYLFGGKEKLIRLDMSEFKTAFGTADLLRQITEKQRRQHFSVLLLDEIEKASPYVFDLFLQAFDDARISDTSGRTVDLRNTIIVMTSNIGTELSEARGIGFLEAGGGRERCDSGARPPGGACRRGVFSPGVHQPAATRSWCSGRWGARRCGASRGVTWAGH